MNLTELRNIADRRITSPLVPVLVKSRLTPNAFTLIGLCIFVGACVAVAAGNFLLGGIIVAFSSFFDLLDGALARGTGRVTSFGALLDSTCDRFAEGALFFALAYFYLPRGMNTEVLLAFAAMVGSFLISYVRARAEGIGVDCKVGFFTRAERIVVLVIGLVFNLMTYALWVLAVLTFATAVQRVIYVRRKTNTINKAK